MLKLLITKITVKNMLKSVLTKLTLKKHVKIDNNVTNGKKIC